MPPEHHRPSSLLASSVFVPIHPHLLSTVLPPGSDLLGAIVVGSSTACSGSSRHAPGSSRRASTQPAPPSFPTLATHAVHWSFLCSGGSWHPSPARSGRQRLLGPLLCLPPTKLPLPGSMPPRPPLVAVTPPLHRPAPLLRPTPPHKYIHIVVLAAT